MNNLASISLKQISARQRTIRPVVAAPSQAGWLAQGTEAFDIQGAVAMPAIAAAETVVVTVTASAGWEALIKRLSANITGPGFEQGSGALIWRILRDGVPLRGYDNLLMEMGDLRTPRETDGILVQPGQKVQLVINNVSFGGAGIALGTFGGVYRQG